MSKVRDYNCRCSRFETLISFAYLIKTFFLNVLITIKSKSETSSVIFGELLLNIYPNNSRIIHTDHPRLHDYLDCSKILLKFGARVVFVLTEFSFAVELEWECGLE